MRIWQIVLLILAVATCGVVRAADAPDSKGLPPDAGFFPLAVWLQSPANAARYRAIGINTYVGLWRGPTEEQLDALDTAGIRLICGQNERSLRFKDRPTIVGWMHGDEPDNAQSLGSGEGIWAADPAGAIVESYRRIRQADPDRPVLLNLGQGVAWDGWYGRGRADEPPGGLSGIPQGLRHRLVRYLPGQPRERRRSPASSGTCPRASIASAAGPTVARMSGAASRRPESATRTASRRRTGPIGGVDGPDPRGQGDHLLRPRVQAEVHRGRAPGGRGDGPRRGGRSTARSTSWPRS